MPRTTPADIHWSTLGEHFAHLHLSQAAGDADCSNQLRLNLETLKSAVALDVLGPPRYQEAYETRLNTLVHVREHRPCNGDCCDESREREAAEYWHFKVHGYPLDAQPRALVCKACRSNFLTFDNVDTCGSCEDVGEDF